MQNEKTALPSQTSTRGWGERTACNNNILLILLDYLWININLSSETAHTNTHTLLLPRHGETEWGMVAAISIASTFWMIGFGIGERIWWALKPSGNDMITDFNSTFLFISKLQLYFNQQNIIGIATGESFPLGEIDAERNANNDPFPDPFPSCLLLSSRTRETTPFTRSQPNHPAMEESHPHLSCGRIRIGCGNCSQPQRKRRP